MSRWPYRGTIVIEAEVTIQSKKIIQVIEEACRMVLELAILEEQLVEVCICKFATRVCDTQMNMAWVQLDLNL